MFSNNGTRISDITLVLRKRGVTFKRTSRSSTRTVTEHSPRGRGPAAPRHVTPRHVASRHGAPGPHRCGQASCRRRPAPRRAWLSRNVCTIFSNVSGSYTVRAVFVRSNGSGNLPHQV